MIAIALVSAPAVIYRTRELQFESTQRRLEKLGGSLQFELVDGNYLLDLHGPAACDETLQTVVPELRRLPTGFTLLGPGEGRLFWARLSGTEVTDVGVAKLCELKLDWLSLDGGQLTDASAVILSKQPTLNGIVLNNTGISASAVAELRDSLPNTTVITDDDHP
jgi:hypothetical protein